MAKKKDKTPPGAPEWMVTYGDMMTLLLCFFVMIVAMSEIKKDERFQKVVDSLQKQFGYNTSIGTAPTANPPDVAPTRRRNAQAAENRELDTGHAREQAPQGLHETIQTIREGQRFTIGGVSTFVEGSAELQPSAHAPLMKIAERIRGLQHKVRVVGHSSAAPLASGSPYDSHMDLSLARAKAVSDWLTGTAADRGRIDPQRIRISGAGKYEPLAHRVYERSEWIKNDRVDVEMLEALAPQFMGESSEDTLLSHRGADPMGETHVAREQ